MKTPNLIAARNFKLRIISLELEIERAPIDCPSRIQMGRDLDLAWRRYREAQGLRS